MLVNLKKDPKKVKALQKARKWSLRGAEDRSEQLWATTMKKHWKADPFTFDAVFNPYVPSGDGYVPDTTTNFTGVYVFDGYDGKTAIDLLTKTRCLDTLVWYGNVDNASQAIEDFSKCVDEPGNYVILLQPMRRDRVYSHDEAWGTFRWHKNGGYSGKASVCSEYFLSEPDEKLRLVYTYTVYRVA